MRYRARRRSGSRRGFSNRDPGGRLGKEWLRVTTAREIQQCGDAQPRWDAVWKKALAAEPLVEPSRLPFYRAEVLTMIAINRESNRTLLLVSKAIQDASKGELVEARKETAEAQECSG